MNLINCFLDDHYWEDPGSKAEAPKRAVFPTSTAGPSVWARVAAWTESSRQLGGGRTRGRRFAAEASGPGREVGLLRKGFLRPLESEAVERVSKPVRFRFVNVIPWFSWIFVNTSVLLQQ